MKVGYPCRLRNATNRPVEIHRGTDVVVLMSGEMLSLDAPDSACARLEGLGVLTRHAPEPPRAPSRKVKRPATGEKPAAKARARATAEAATSAKGPSRTRSAGKAAAKTGKAAEQPPASRPRRTAGRTAKDQTGESR